MQTTRKLITLTGILLFLMIAISIPVSAQNILPPVANLNLDTARHDSQEAVEVFDIVYFDGSNSYDPDGENLTYEWDFGDGSSGFGKKSTHVYKKIGFYKVSLTVNDSIYNNTSTIEIIVISTKPHEPIADGGRSQEVNSTDIVHFDASNSYDPDGDSLTYSWNFGDGGSPGFGETTTHIYDNEGIYKVRLTVKDHYHSSNDTLTIKVGEGPPINPEQPSGDSEGEEPNLFLWVTISIVIVILVLFAIGWVYSKRKPRGLEAPVLETTRPTAASTKTEIDELLSGKKPAGTSRAEPLSNPKRVGMAALSGTVGGAGVARASGASSPPSAAKAKPTKGQIGRTIDVDAYRKRLENLEKKETKKRDKLLKKQLDLETKKMEKEMEKDLKDLGMDF